MMHRDEALESACRPQLDLIQLLRVLMELQVLTEASRQSFTKATFSSLQPFRQGAALQLMIIAALICIRTLHMFMMPK